MELRKYPKTPHLSFSNNIDSSDNVLSETCTWARFKDGVIITEKMDGENITIHKHGWFTRSLDSRPRPYHSFLQGNIIPVLQANMPDWIILHGEYMYARHAIKYDDLKGYFYLFAVEDETGEFKSWNETEKWAQQLNLPMPKVLNFAHTPTTMKDVERLVDLCEKSGAEGFVIRNATAFDRDNFAENVAKYVCHNHKKTPETWDGREKNSCIID